MHRRFWLSERSRQAYIAIAIALFAGAIFLLKPLDIAAWSIQSRLADRAASGEIGFIEIQNYSERSAAEENRTVARIIRKLDAKGVDRAFINLPLRRSNSPEVDRELRMLLEANKEHVFLAEFGPGEQSTAQRAKRTDPFFRSGMRTFDSFVWQDFLGFVWGFSAYNPDGREVLAFGLHEPETARGEVFIDGTIDATSIPRIDARDLTRALDAPALPRTFVIGTDDPDQQVRVANKGYVPSSIAHILAAETLLRGSGHGAPFYVLPLLAGALLLLGLRLTRTNRQRRFFYAAWSLTIPIAFVATGVAGVHMPFGNTILLVAAYAAMRGVVFYRQRHLFVDPTSSLPNFSALKRDISDDAGANYFGIVVVKILRLDSIFSKLSLGERRLYLKQIANRLSLMDGSTKIYSDGGKYLAFLARDLTSSDYRSHLAGLRAIASQPVSISGQSIDVAITIGADLSSRSLTEHGLSSAIAAADQAREAFRPVFVVSDAHDDDEEWDHSLTARLAQALAEDRIAIKLQPQVDLETGKFVGAEVLARWQDHAGNEISPARFILQCERMGRLDDLTSRILEKGMAALQILQRSGRALPLSINVSAVQFVDERIVEIVEKCLANYDIDPALLKIEMTETARIEDFETARGIFERLRKQGIRFSLDDFGVGSANLEALQRLPFDEVKIDRMFIQQLTRSSKTRAIVEGVLRTTSAAGITSVAEGIEDRETHALLSSMGCDRGQGYFIAKPMVVSQLASMLDLNREVVSRPRYG